MIKEAELKEDRQGYRFKDPNITFELIQNNIKNSAGDYGIPVAFTMDQIKGGGLFNATYQDCLVIYNPQHPYDYFRYVITLKKMGNITFVSFFYYGSSANTGKENKVNQRNEHLSGQLINLAIGKNHKAAYDEEYSYYSLLGDVFTEAMGGG